MKANELKVGMVVANKGDNRAFGDMLVLELHEHVFKLIRPYVDLNGPVPLPAMDESFVHETSSWEFEERRFSPLYAEKLKGR